MMTIGIIGASGQVGTEVCLFLKTYPEVQVIAIVRSEISASLLRRLGVECRVGTFGEEPQCRKLLEGLDVIADFSLPSGAVQTIKGHYFNNISKALQYSEKGAKYIFISSINAFGMGGSFNRAKNYLIPHSIYAMTKRYGERTAFAAGKKHNKEVYVFRLGHVHGLLQKVSKETKDLVNAHYRVFKYPDTPSYTIFCSSIAEGFAKVGEGKEQPGNYVLISEPAWSWKEVLSAFADGKNLDVQTAQTTRQNPFSALLVQVKNEVVKRLMKYKDTLQANLVHRLPEFEKKSKAEMYVRRAAQQISDLKAPYIFQPDDIHEGVFPGKRLNSLSDSRTSMAEKTKMVKAMLDSMSSYTFGNHQNETF